MLNDPSGSVHGSGNATSCKTRVGERLRGPLGRDAITERVPAVLDVPHLDNGMSLVYVSINFGKQAMPLQQFHVEFADRRSPVLSPSQLACLSHLPTVNLTAGCVHGCAYCYIQGYRNYPGAGRGVIYRNAAALLAAELRRCRTRPAAVYFSPSSDLFQPIPQLLDTARRVLSILFEHDVGVVFLTKGTIPAEHMALLVANRQLVRA